MSSDQDEHSHDGHSHSHAHTHPHTHNQSGEDIATLEGDLKLASTILEWESGDIFDAHDEAALNWLDQREPARMKAFRDMLIAAFSNAADVLGLDVAFDYSTPGPPRRVVVTATMRWGQSTCELIFPRPRAQPPQQASIVQSV